MLSFASRVWSDIRRIGEGRSAHGALLERAWVSTYQSSSHAGRVRIIDLDTDTDEGVDEGVGLGRCCCGSRVSLFMKRRSTRQLRKAFSARVVALIRCSASDDSNTTPRTPRNSCKRTIGTVPRKRTSRLDTTTPCTARPRAPTTPRTIPSA